MERKPSASKGWHSFRFEFGASSLVTQYDEDEMQLSTDVTHRAEELAFGGWRAYVDDDGSDSR